MAETVDSLEIAIPLLDVFVLSQDQRNVPAVPLTADEDEAIKAYEDFFCVAGERVLEVGYCQPQSTVCDIMWRAWSVR